MLLEQYQIGTKKRELQKQITAALWKNRMPWEIRRALLTKADECAII